MAKYYGKIGYVFTSESSPGIYKPVTVERDYSGDILRSTNSFQNQDKVNNDIRVSAQLSIISDPYAIENSYALRYAWYEGARWRITSVEPRYPRIILSLGELYNNG